MATPIPVNAASFRVDELVRVLRGTLVRGGPDGVRGVAIDSRAVAAGGAFVALAGASYDGHAFVGAAVDAGAACVIVREGTADVPRGPAVVAVGDTLTALGALGRAHRRRWGGPIVCITGSVGKTTTKELAAAALEGTGLRVLRTSGNLNNLVGTPMTLLTLGREHDIGVIEIGTNTPGEIAALAAIVEPTVGLVTLVAEAHTEGLGGLAAIAREKGALYDALGPSSAIVVNVDDREIEAIAARSPAGTRVTFGVSDAADVRLVACELGADARTRCTWRVRGEEVTATLALFGRAAALSATAALGVVVALGRSATAAASAMAHVEPLAGRGLLRARADGVAVIDDSYNASPRAVAAGIESARALADVRRAPLVLVLGDMKELADADREHRRVGELAAAARADLLVGVGPAMLAATAAARAAGVPVIEAPTADDASAALARALPPRAVVLVKGSRAVGTDRVALALLGAVGGRA